MPSDKTRTAILLYVASCVSHGPSARETQEAQADLFHEIEAEKSAAVQARDDEINEALVATDGIEVWPLPPSDPYRWAAMSSWDGNYGPTHCADSPLEALKAAAKEKENQSVVTEREQTK